MDNRAPEAFVFMRVGNHAGETFDAILERKRREFEYAGMIFWGYGGTTLHPIRHVQPFVKSLTQHGGTVQIIMETINSKADPDILPAQEYSVDGLNWEPIPDGIEVRGSRYAVILDEIKPGHLDLDLSRFEVGIGPSRGRRADAYVRGRVDKGCFVASGSSAEQSDSTQRIIPITYQARLIDPFAVMLRH